MSDAMLIGILSLCFLIWLCVWLSKSSWLIKMNLYLSKLHQSDQTAISLAMGALESGKPDLAREYLFESLVECEKITGEFLETNG